MIYCLINYYTLYKLNINSHQSDCADVQAGLHLFCSHKTKSGAHYVDHTCDWPVTRQLTKSLFFKVKIAAFLTKSLTIFIMFVNFLHIDHKIKEMVLCAFRSEPAWGPLKRVSNWKLLFLIFHPKHMLWVLKRTVSMRRFFWAPKTHVQTDG